MQTFKNADPAFPCVECSPGVTVFQYPGMSRTDFFAAHAPNKIPKWFKDDAYKELNPKPVEPNYEDFPEYKGLTDLEKKEFDGWRRDPIYDLPDNLQFFQQKWEAYTDFRRKWEVNKEVSEYFAWRQYYGQMMGDPSQLEKPMICQE